MKKISEAQTQRMLAKELVRLFQAPNQLVALEEQIKVNQDQSHSEREMMLKLIDGFGSQLDLCEFRYASIEASLKKLAMLTDEYFRDKIVVPVCENLIDLFDLCNQLSVGDLAVMAKMKHFKGKLLELLERYGAEIIDVAIGLPFDPRFCRPVQFEPTKTPDEDRVVVRVVRAGFLFAECEKTIRPAEVAVKRMKNKIKEK